MAAHRDSYLRKFRRLAGETKGYVPLGILLTDFDDKPLHYVITNEVFPGTCAAELTDYMARFASNVDRPEFMAAADGEGGDWGEEGVLHDGIGMFARWRTKPGGTLAPYGHFAVELIEAAALQGVCCSPPRVPKNYGGCLPFGDLDATYERYVDCLVEALDPPTRPEFALLLSKRLAEGYEKRDVPPGGLSPINVPGFGHALKECLDEHFKAIMPKAPAPLSFDNAFTAKLPPLVAPATADKPLLVLHVRIRDLPDGYHKDFAPPEYLYKLIHPPKPRPAAAPAAAAAGPSATAAP